MRIVCAPDSFKGSLTAEQAAAAMARGAQRADPTGEVIACGIADGGEGTLATLVAATSGRLQVLPVRGPRGLLHSAPWGWLGDGSRTGVVEMAAASGLTLLAPQQRDPTRTSTFGCGQLIAAALAAGAERILLGLGGSATHDGGCGAAQALGFRFLDRAGTPIDAPITGGDLARIATLDPSGLDPRLAQVDIAACCDVDNPLVGADGAAAVFAPQKGANPTQVRILDAGLAHLGALWRDQLGHDVLATPGAGAAGGFGGGVLAMLGGRLQSGIELVLQAVAFDRRLEGATLCLTGEGRFDGQSVRGKACSGVTAVARRVGVPVVGLFGSIDPAGEQAAAALGMAACHSIRRGESLEEAMRNAARLLEDRTAEVVAGW